MGAGGESFTRGFLDGAGRTRLNYKLCGRKRISVSNNSCAKANRCHVGKLEKLSSESDGYLAKVIRLCMEISCRQRCGEGSFLKTPF